jgi:PAS domain S-box-containing protein
MTARPDGRTATDPLLVSLLTCTSDGVILVDADGRIAAWNPAAAAMWGRAAADVVGRDLAELPGIPPGVVTAVDAARRGASPRPVAIVLTVADLERRLSATAHAVEGGSTLLLVRDRTEHIDMQRHLMRVADQLASLQAIGGVGLWTWHVPSGNVEWSEGMYRIHAVAPADFVGTIAWAMSFVRDDHRDRVTAVLVEAAEGGGPVQTTLPIVRGDGSEVWLETRAERVADDAGAGGVVGVAMDITAYHLALETLSEANGRLERLGSAMAHDIQSPLVAIRHYADLLGGSGIPLGDIDPGYVVARIRANADGALDLIRSTLQSVLRGGQVRPTSTFPLSRVVDWVVERLVDGVEQVGGSIVRVEPMPRVESVEEVVRQVLVNLLANAIKYRHPDRPLQVTVSAQQTADDTVVVEVRDNGRGVPEAERARVFEQGYRSPGHGDVEGTGIGLASCRTALAELGERIWVADGVEGGASVRFTLAAAPVGADAPPDGDGPPAG